MPMDEPRDYDRDLRYIATIASASIGAIVATTEHEHVAWFGLLCVAGLWVVVLLATRRTP